MIGSGRAGCAWVHSRREGQRDAAASAADRAIPPAICCFYSFLLEVVSTCT